ncbi:MAG: hypothetical protein JNG85_10495, partial [Spirochaetaceae bacterium]|nr:hypothetical protein [Spirochaetaceae bacterium]
MSGWVGFFPVAGRFLLALALAAAGLALLAAALARPRPVRRPGPAIPGRRGLAELSRLLAKAARRPYARDLAAERLRALARDRAALRRCLDEAGARAAVESGGAGFPPRLAAFLAADWLARDRRRGAANDDDDFPRRFDEALED